MDFKSAFLQSPIDGEIYVKPPPQVKVPRGYVLRLLKGLYGLKQGAFLWFQALSTLLLAIGFVRCPVDPALWVLNSDKGYISLSTWVDDCSVATSSDSLWNSVYERIKSVFPVGEFGPLKWHLGMRVRQTIGTVELDLAKYIGDMLAKFGLSDANTAKCRTPANASARLPSNEDCPKSDDDKLDQRHYPFRALLGSLMYIGCWCRPDIMTALSIVARYQDRPGKRHWQWLRHIALYLKHTQYLCLRFSRTARRFLDLTGYVDADYANSDLDGAKSRTGYLFFCCGAPIVWRSTLQPVVAQSTCESEYIAMNAATHEAEWLHIAANFLFNPCEQI